MPDDEQFEGLPDLELERLRAEVDEYRIKRDFAFVDAIMTELKRREQAELERRQQSKEPADAC